MQLTYRKNNNIAGINAMYFFVIKFKKQTNLPQLN